MWALAASAATCAVLTGYGATRLHQQASTTALVGAFGGLLVLLLAFALFITRPVPSLMALWVVYVIQQPLTVYTRASSHSLGSLVSKIDDVTLMVFITAVFLRALVRPPAPTAVRRPPAMSIALAVLTVGLLSTLVQSSFGPWTVVGAWLSLKFWFVLAAALLMPWRPKDFDVVSKIIFVTAGVVALFGVADYISPSAVHSLIHYSQHGGNGRGGAIQSVFPSASRYSNFMTMAAALALARLADRVRLIDVALTGALALAGLASLRLRGLLALVFAAFVLLAVIKDNRVARAGRMVLVACVAVAVLGSSAFSSQFSKFTSNGSTARAQLYSNALTLADGNAPFGVGFGRYGSYASVIYYSPYYTTLNMSGEFGFSPSHPDYLNDTGWAGYIGETGFLGSAILLTGLMLLGRRLLVNLRRGPPACRSATLAAISVLSAAVIMSIASAALLDSVIVVAIAMCVGCAFAVPEAAVGREP
jgi:hypothetical protein